MASTTSPAATMAKATPAATTPATTTSSTVTTGTGSTAPNLFEFKEYEESGFVDGMFGSLMQVANSASPDNDIYPLVDNWWKIIQKWYPDMQSKVYTVPPVHFNTVSYKPRPEKLPAPDEPYAKFGMCTYKPSQYSTVKDDEAQQRTLWTISSFLEDRKSAAFVLSNMDFQSYLNKDYVVTGSKVPKYTKPNNSNSNEQGDADVLVIDKNEGIFVFEVKAIGDNDMFRSTTEEDKLQKLCDKLEGTITKQVKKEKCVVQKLLSALDPQKEIKVRAGFVLPNISRECLKKAVGLLSSTAQTNLKTSLGLDRHAHLDKISDITLCADDMPGNTLEGSSIMDEQVLQKVDKVWTALRNVDGYSKPMDEDLYEHIVALFCGPLTTVKIYTEKSMPRVRLIKRTVGKGKNAKEKTNVIFEEVRTPAGAARKVALRFSELILQKDQIDILQREEDFVHLQGPPGTGKTLLLLLRVLTWLDAGHKVWIISFLPPSRSVTHVLFEQTKRMLDAFCSTSEAEEKKKQLDMFILSRPQETLDKQYYERRLFKFRDRAKHKDPYPDAGFPRRPTLPAKALPQDRKVCLVVDESGMAGTGLNDFFEQVAICHKRKDFLNDNEFSKGLSVWSASVERCGRPKYAAKPGKSTPERFGTCWKLKMPLRCPPTVQRALMLVQPSLDARNICFFKNQFMMANPACPRDRSEVKNPEEEGPTGPYNQYPADGLEVFLIAHGSHERAHEDVWYCKECGNELADYLTKVLKITTSKTQQVMSENHLKCHDVMIVATQNSFQFSLPIAGFMAAMKKRKLKVAVNVTREEGKTAITDEDTILIVDMTSVHGLERAVIIVVPEVNMPPQLPTMYKTSFTLPEESKTKAEEEKVSAEAAVKETQAADEPIAFEKIRQDDPMKEALEAADGQDFSISAAGEFVKEDDSDEEKTTADTGRKETVMEVQEEQSQQETTPSGAPSQPQKTPTDGKDYDTSDEEDEGIDSLTYADNKSERKIKAALASLSDQSRKDIFYIGSRAVCQLILVHLGKKDDGESPAKAEPTPSESMDT
ncbi:uncharacterized protein [Littorina saxatilis]|uniref:Uncharacterized protein n=1 Tax=Littorina saxatilis TaxID=31220 RepID=A0AAN9BIX0_9CAEN